MRRGPATLVALAAALTLLACGEPKPASRNPGEVPEPPFVAQRATTSNGVPGVVMILVDTLRADHLGAYGSRAGLTPNIDALAERSHLFERAVAASSWTRPAIGAMLTSRYPTSLGLLDKTDSLPDSAVTLAEVLHDQAGFQTFAVVTNGNIAEQWGFSQGFDRFAWPHLRRRYPGDFAIHVAEGVTQRALEVLDQRDPTRPFFLFVLYVDPHDPYLPHPGLLPDPEPPGRFDGSRKQLQRLDRLRGAGEPADYDRVRYLYSGEVRYADHWIGRFLDGLDERGIGDSVMLTLTADHGEGLWSHNRRGHGNDLYEESVHVPLLVRYPGMSPADASRISTPVSLLDLAPTILATVGAPKPSSFQGFDLRPLTRGESRGAAFDYVYSEMDHRRRNFESIRRGDWKLIRNRSLEGRDPKAFQIFDLSADPAEQSSRLGETPARQRQRLVTALEHWGLAVLADSGARRRLALTDLDEGTLRSLRGLGYIGGAELDATLAARREGGAVAPPAEDLPAVPLAVLDLATGWDEARLQVERGLEAPPPGADGVALGEEASVLLHRKPESDTWQVELELGPRPRAAVSTVSVQATGGDTARVDVYGAGDFVLTGELPADAGPTVRLLVECRTTASAEGGTSAEPCATIRKIEIQ